MVARAARERQPAHSSFLTAAEGQRSVPANGSGNLTFSGPIFTPHDYVPNGSTSPRLLPPTHDLQERLPILGMGDFPLNGCGKGSR